MATVTKPSTFSSGETIRSAEVNSNFDTIYNDYNGNITNANIASGAAIAGSKLDLSAPGTIGATTPAVASFSNITADTITGTTVYISGATNAHGLNIQVVDVLTNNVYGLSVSSNAAQVNSPLIRFNNVNTANNQYTAEILNSGYGSSLSVGGGVNTAGNAAAIQINVTNAGAGTGCAFSFNGDVAESAVIVTANSEGTVYILVGSALKRLAYYPA